MSDEFQLFYDVMHSGGPLVTKMSMEAYQILLFIELFIGFLNSYRYKNWHFI